jgi:hypothetical protein
MGILAVNHLPSSPAGRPLASHGVVVIEQVDASLLGGRFAYFMVDLPDCEGLTDFQSSI